jgi:hypothetical protein
VINSSNIASIQAKYCQFGKVTDLVITSLNNTRSSTVSDANVTIQLLAGLKLVSCNNVWPLLPGSGGNCLIHYEANSD